MTDTTTPSPFALYEPADSVGESFIEPRADPILAAVSAYGGACMNASAVSFKKRPEEFKALHDAAERKWIALALDVVNLRRESRASQAAAQKAADWLNGNRERLHTADCSYHEPSARCSCGLHQALSLTRAIANGNAALFIEPKESPRVPVQLSGEPKA